MLMLANITVPPNSWHKQTTVTGKYFCIYLEYILNNFWVFSFVFFFEWGWGGRVGHKTCDKTRTLTILKTLEPVLRYSFFPKRK